MTMINGYISKCNFANQGMCWKLVSKVRVQVMAKGEMRWGKLKKPANTFFDNNIIKFHKKFYTEHCLGQSGKLERETSMANVNGNASLISENVQKDTRTSCSKKNQGTKTSRDINLLMSYALQCTNLCRVLLRAMKFTKMGTRAV